MFVLQEPLREGEPDAVVSNGQPEPQEPASAPVEVASDPVIDETPAPEAEGQPADQPEAEPVVDNELNDDDWNALKERYPDKFKVEAPKEPEPPKKESDPYYAAISRASAESYTRIQAAQRQIIAGDLPDDPDALAADLDLAGEWHAASERRGQLFVNRLVVERALGIDPAKLDDNDTIQQQYGDLLNNLEATQVNAFRLRNSAVREHNPAKRAEIITKALTMDSTAVGEFYRLSADLLVEHGKRVGKAEIEKTVGKRMEQTAAQARSNGSTEAHAKAKALVAAGTVMSTASNGSRPTRSDAELLADPTTPIQTLIEIRNRQRNGG